MPVGNGERLCTIWEFSELLAQGGPQYVRPDVALAGGLTHCKKIAAIAEGHHCAVVTHNFLGPLISAASYHLDTSIPNFVTQEYTKADEGEQNAVFKSSWQREGGYMPVSAAPGLGVELDDDLIEQTPYVPMNNAQTPLRNDGSAGLLCLRVFDRRNILPLMPGPSATNPACVADASYDRPRACL